MSLGLIILVSALVIASLTDVAHRRIPNAITYPMAAFGLIFHFALSGMAGFLFSMSGILVGAGLLLLFYVLGGMGAGDVKLMAAVGSILGPADVFTASLYSALVGGFYALVVLFRHGGLRDTVYWLAPALAGMIPAETMQKSGVAPGASMPRLCYGLAISLGTVLAVLRPL